MLFFFFYNKKIGFIPYSGTGGIKSDIQKKKIGVGRKSRGAVRAGTPNRRLRQDAGAYGDGGQGNGEDTCGAIAPSPPAL